MSETDSCPPGAPSMPKYAVTVLGYLGAVPFYIAIALLALGLGEAGLRLFQLYSLAIMAFLCGSWWGRGLLSAERALTTLVLSNGFLLVGVAGVFALPATSALAVLAALYALLWWGERILPPLRAQPAYYQKLRSGLTALVVLAHGLLAALI